MAMPAEPPDTTSAASAARNAASAAAAPADQGAEYLQSVLAAGGFGDSITVSEVTDN